MRRNADLTAHEIDLVVSDEQYDLFRRYVRSRHGDGDMALMNRRDYAAMVLSSPVDTGIVEFRDSRGALVAACLMDRGEDGLSAVYSFFDPVQSGRSLGSFMVLWLVAEAARRGIPHVYLGFWIENCQKMSYKERFSPLEAFGSDGWRPLDP